MTDIVNRDNKALSSKLPKLREVIERNLEQPPKPEAPKSGEVIKTDIRQDLLPKGWKIEVGRTTTKEGHTFEGEVDWLGKRIVVADKKNINNPEIINHEIAHVKIERGLSEKARNKLLDDYIEIKTPEWNKGKFEPEWIVKNKFHHEEIAMDYGDYLNGKKVSVGLKKLFDKLEQPKQPPKPPEGKLGKSVKETIAEQKPLSEESKILPETTTIKNAVVNAERKARGLEPIETSMKRDWGKVWDEAKGKIKSGEVDPSQFSKDLAENPRPITDTERAILTYERLRLKELRTKMGEVLSKTKDSELRAQGLKDALLVEEMFNNTELASKHTGSEIARALNITKMEIKDDYTLAPLLQRARTANNFEPLNQEMRTKLEGLSKKILQRETEVKELQTKLGNLEAEKFLRDIAEEKFKKRGERRTKTKEVLDTEYNDLVKEWANTQQANLLIDPKQVQLMVKMAVNRLQKGGVTIEQVVDQIYQVGKQYIKELTLDDVRDALRTNFYGNFAEVLQNKTYQPQSRIRRNAENW
jgi:hypothetical protein